MNSIQKRQQEAMEAVKSVKIEISRNAKVDINGRHERVAVLVDCNVEGLDIRADVLDSMKLKVYEGEFFATTAEEFLDVLNCITAPMYVKALAVEAIYWDKVACNAIEWKRLRAQFHHAVPKVVTDGARASANRLMLDELGAPDWWVDKNKTLPKAKIVLEVASVWA